MIYDPSHDLAGRSRRIVQQPDIMPTLLDYLGLDDKCTCFGTSVFRQSKGFQVAYGNGFYLMNCRDTATATICGPYVNGNEEDLQFLKAYLQKYRDTFGRE